MWRNKVRVHGKREKTLILCKSPLCTAYIAFITFATSLTRVVATRRQARATDLIATLYTPLRVARLENLIVAESEGDEGDSIFANCETDRP